MLNSIGQRIKNVQAIDPNAYTASGAGNAIDTSGHNSIVFDLTVTAQSGTTPTLDVKVQECDTAGGTYTDISAGSYADQHASAYAQFTGTSTLPSRDNLLALDLVGKRKRYLRLYYTIGGTNPNWTFGAGAVMDAGLTTPSQTATP